MWGRPVTGGRARTLAVLVAVAAASVLWASGTGAQRAARVGQTAPEITGRPWLNGEPLSLAGLRGRVVLVEFWTYG
jgi:hypothetical protein